jgi:hypothetical protein
MRPTTLPLGKTPGFAIFTLLATAFAPPLGGFDEAQRRPVTDAAPDEAAAPAPRLLDRLDAWFWRMEQRAVEEYLGKAQDVYDLEVRIRDLERAPMSRYY